MNRFDAQDCHSERIVPSGELSFFGEAELAKGGSCGFQAQDIDRVGRHLGALDNQAAMGFLDMFEAMRSISQGIALIQRKSILKRGQQGRLVAFDRQAQGNFH
jgi:hypothetical protein